MSVLTRISDSRVRPWLGTVVRLAVAAIWIWSALPKMLHPLRFVQTVRVYDVTPEWLTKALAYGLPVLALSLAVLLVVGVLTRAAAAVSALLFVVFLVGLVQAAARSIQLDCGCFGVGGPAVDGTHYPLDILRTVGMLVLCLLLVVWPLTRLSVDDQFVRSDRVEMPSAKRMRSDQGRRKYQAQVAARARAARTRTLFVSSGLGIVVVLVVVIGIGVQSTRVSISGTTTATNATPTTGVTVGRPSAVAVDVFEDYACAKCVTLESTLAPDLAARVKAGTALVRYHPIAVLDPLSKNTYSTRAANAALCASDISSAQYVKFHDYLFRAGVQPAPHTAGPSDAMFSTYAKAAGITGDPLTTFGTCVTSRQYAGLVQALTEVASRRQISSTPVVLVNDRKLSTVSTAAVDAALTAAAAKK